MTIVLPKIVDYSLHIQRHWNIRLEYSRSTDVTGRAAQTRTTRKCRCY